MWDKLIIGFIPFNNLNAVEDFGIIRYYMKRKNVSIAVATALGGTGNDEDFMQYIMKNKTKYTRQFEY